MIDVLNENIIRPIMRRQNFLVLLAVCLGLLTACASRPGPELLRSINAPKENTKVVSIYVATTRQRDQAGAFTSGRAHEISYIRYKISIPPSHKRGNVEWPTSKSDPQKDFVVVEEQLLDRGKFESEIARKRAGRAPNVGVFVHGYNTNFTEAVFRTAQIAFDAKVETTPILFAWPSEGTVGGYLTDKDAVTYSRDQLSGLLSGLAKISTQGPITVVGHSMGGWLTAEAVRQLRIGGKNKVISRLHIILAAPDIDVDVFRAQMLAIGPLSPPLTVLVSRDDVALRASEFLSTSRRRVGRMDVSDPSVEEAVRKANLQIVDISDIETSDSFKHNRFIAFAALYPEVAGTNTNLRQAGAFVFNAAGATLSSPFLLAGKIVGGR